MPLTDSILNLANTTIPDHASDRESPRAGPDSAPGYGHSIGQPGWRPAHFGEGFAETPRGKNTQDLISIWTLEPLQLGDIGQGNPARLGLCTGRPPRAGASSHGSTTRE